MSWRKRPTCSETEEDILKLQEEFLASKEKPAASVQTGLLENTKKASKNSKKILTHMVLASIV